jgi:N-carbamoyl-L-amino-acid hydrolase
VPQRRTRQHVNAARIREHLEGLSAFGRPAGGSFADGVSRVGYSDADVAGRKYVMDLLRAAGVEPRIDPAGNILARREGREGSLPVVLFGSHIDSVPSGGNFDGDVGSIGAIEVLQTIGERAITTRRPLELVIWANEEGVAYENGLCGSRAAAGKLEAGELDHVWQGVKKRDAIRRIGGDPDRILEARRAPGSFRAYLELHIEQGGVLDKEGVAIGVVTEISITPISHHDAALATPEIQSVMESAAGRLGYTHKRYVQQADYNYYFREGFNRGYRDGYDSRTQYGQYANGSRSILGSVLSQILNLQTMR